MPEIVCRFAEFELDRSAYQLRRKGRPVSLERIPLDLLFLLAQRRGTLVTRQEILERIWGKDVFLDTDSAINTAVRKIRRALRDDADAPRFIETVPARGYRFLASVSEVHDAGEASITSRPQKTTLVGRERELSVLRADLDRAASGSGRLVLISGEPGIGKTRLAEEVVAMARANGMAILSGRCLDDEQAVPFLPFVEMLESIVDHAHGPDTLRTTFGEQGPELTRLIPRLRSLAPEFSPRTDLGPAEARRYLFNCFGDFVARLAGGRPALMILEDLHWADDSTLSLLDHLIQRLAGSPMLVVGTYRDSELDAAGGLAKYVEKLLRGRMVTQVRLKSLLAGDVAAMLQNLSGQEPPPDVTETILVESKGNPFLIEELFRHLQEEDRLYDSAGKFRKRLEIGETDAPPSVRLVVTRRLERLGDATRKMLGTAAVIGRLFSFEVLRNSSDADPDAILECVEEAEKCGLISPVEDSPDLRFEFSHELTRQAVIAGTSVARRQSLHLKVAEAIERVYNSALEGHLAELAHHYRSGGNRAKSIDFLHRAGAQAVSRAMYTEAESYFAAALDEVVKMPETRARDERELRVRSSYARAMAVSRGYGAPEVFEMSSLAHALAEKTGNLAELVQQLWVEVGFPETRGELGHAAGLIDELLLVAEREGSPVSLAMANTYQVENRFYRGDFLGADEHFERGRAFFEAPEFAKIQYGPAAAFGMASWDAWVLGRPEVARERILCASKRTRRDPYELAVLNQMVAVLHAFMREFREAEAAAAQALIDSGRRGFPELAMWHRIPLGIARAELGRTAEGVALLKQAVLAMTKREQRITMTHTLTWLAEAQALDGAIDDALRSIGDALIANPEELYVRPETYRVRGELRLKRGECAKAEGDFREAIAIAKKMRAKAWELRAATSLARLLRDTNRRDEARAMLSEIYNWFTEGFDTADLKAAKALLDELRA
jgi:DNA-binding winged helix-turn-helix (wHTH) protein/tetratricopeptide (TPR) repeat protein